MNKKLFFALVALAVTFAVLSKNETSKPEISALAPRTEKSAARTAQASEAPKESFRLLESNSIGSATVAPSVLQNYLDPRLSHAQRLQAYEEMSKGLPQTLGQFYQASIAQNPYARHSKEAHSFSGMRFGEEESFRLMALQVVEKEVLKDSNQLALIEHISQNAQSTAVRTTAREMLPFIKKGKSYSLLMQQAMSSVNSF